MSDQKTYTAECVCKAVRLTFTGEPVMQNSCHCHSCRKWNQTSPVATVVYHADSMKIESGEKFMEKFNVERPEMDRFFCRNCGYRVFNKNKNLPFVSVPANNLEGLSYRPLQHVFCQYGTEEGLDEARLSGLPMFADLPTFAGGTGELMK